jgi:hypothetical protein
MIEIKDNEKTRVLNDVKKQLEELVSKRNKEKKEFNKMESKRIEGESSLAGLVNDMEKQVFMIKKFG